MLASCPGPKSVLICSPPPSLLLCPLSECMCVCVCVCNCGGSLHTVCVDGIYVLAKFAWASLSSNVFYVELKDIFPKYVLCTLRCASFFCLPEVPLLTSPSSLLLNTPPQQLLLLLWAHLKFAAGHSTWSSCCGFVLFFALGCCSCCCCCSWQLFCLYFMVISNVLSCVCAVVCAQVLSVNKLL